MFIRIIPVLLIIASLVFASFSFAQPDMREGLWEITVKMDMPDMPMQMPAMTHTQCITKKDLIPQKPEKNQDCKTISSKTSGNTVSWVIQCRDKDGTVAESSGKVTYKGDKFDGTIDMIVNQPGQGKMKMTQRMSGKRIGECR